ncbi:dynamin family protein [Aldersonia sp. NBC_00410]|uniref:dynamin family protein n=1 Tax=Aldersonia sp. NBC_00410 TaxID=2975954 RepID=UPI0022597A2C|nr:dynamin family protein [Aldersonia sp. NBC_00410]MCX5046658.1 dynamin family protein [Aldersonia sp. NBC_00410]
MTAPALPTAPTETAPGRVDSVLDSAGKILRAYKFGDTADLAERQAGTSNQQRAVVVVGEVKRGKSALVNALVSRREASPVDVDVTTSATVHVVAASERHPDGTADLIFPGTATRIPATELPEWVTATGRYVRDPGVESLPTRAVLPVESRWLAEHDIVVMDTPGTGGLDQSHAQLATMSAQQACVLVVVCDSSTPITAPEMAFLRAASASVDSVIVAVTKTDKNLRRYRPIVAENKRLIREHTGRDIPVIAVSCVRAHAADELPAGPRRDQGLASTGIVELRAVIEAKLDLGARLPAVNALRTSWEGLRLVADKLRTDIAALTDSPAVVADLTQEQNRLTELKNHSGQWELHLGRDLTLARQSAVSVLDEQLDELKTKWTTRINKNGLEVLRKNPQVFTAEIETDLIAAMGAAVQKFLDELHAIIGPLFDSPAVWDEIQQQIMASLQTDTLQTGNVASKRQGLIDPTVLSMGMMGTSMLGALLGIGAIAGVVWIGVNLGYRAMRAGKQNLLTWLRETLGTARGSTARMLEAALTTARPEIVIRYREHLRTSMEQVQKQMIDVKEAARLDAATREQSLKKLTGNQRVVDARISEIHTLITELTAIPPSRETSSPHPEHSVPAAHLT